MPEPRATNLVHAAGGGTTLTLIAMPEHRRDMGLSDLARDAVIAAITTDAPVAPQPGPVGAAVALRALLPQTTTLSASERTLLVSGSTASPTWTPELTRGSRRPRQTSAAELLSVRAATTSGSSWLPGGNFDRPDAADHGGAASI